MKLKVETSFERFLAKVCAQRFDCVSKITRQTRWPFPQYMLFRRTISHFGALEIDKTYNF